MQQNGGGGHLWARHAGAQARRAGEREMQIRAQAIREGEMNAAKPPHPPHSMHGSPLQSGGNRPKTMAERERNDAVEPPVGGPVALWELVHRYTPALLAYCARRLEDRHLAEDAVQEVFSRAHAMMSSDRLHNPPAWLFATARLCCHEFARKRRRLRLLRRGLALIAPRGTSTASERNQRERQQRLDASLHQLDDAERSLLYMKHTQNMKCREIAEATGRPLGTVTSALARTYGKLRTLIQMQEGSDRELRRH